MTAGAAAEWLELLRAAQQGDDAALAVLLERLYVRVATRMLRESSIRAQLAGTTAEDIAAETIERFAAALGHCRATTDAEVLAWAYQIAANVARDHFRTAAARVFRACVADALEQLETTSSLADLWDEATPVDEDEAQLVRAVFAGYDSLPEPAAEIIWHRLTGNPSWAETAGVFDTTESGARRRFQRAVGHLRRAALRMIEAMPVSQREAARRALARRLSSGGRHIDQ